MSMPCRFLKIPHFLKHHLFRLLPELPQGANVFWSCMCVLAFLACLSGEYFINKSSQDQATRMILAMQSRAESLIWALESGARFFRQKQNQPLQELLMEMAMQPGIAWIAITDVQGRILWDSDAHLSGAILYTAGELESLAPSSKIQGRFSPDDPSLYETWKLFRPERLAKAKKSLSNRSGQTFFIFVALNASAFQKDMDAYLERQRLLATLFISSTLCFLALLFYIRNFWLSRRKLLATEALASEIIANYPGALLLTDAQGKILLANKRAKELLKLSAARSNILELDNYDWASSLRELQEKGNILEKELDLPLAEAGTKAISLSGILIPGEADAQALFILRDLSEIRLLRKRLSQSRRFVAVGKMAAGLAHEIRNPLSSIRGYAHYLLGKLEKDPLAKASAELLVDETRRINDALTDLLALARAPQLNMAHNSLSEIVRKAAMIVKLDAENKKIALKVELPTKKVQEWPLSDADKLLQAILNLLLNAMQFSQEGGEVELALRRNHGEEKGWLISVRDNGPGITESALSQIFNPYYTNREGGTGLGLAISRQLVESHGGEISVVSAPGKGALFTIFLPDSTI